jgi:dipeptidase E
MNILLLSNSTNAGGYLHYAIPLISELSSATKNAVFIPFAGISRDWDEYTRIVTVALAPLSLNIEPLHRSVDPVETVRNSSLLLIGGGNTFNLLHHCRRLGLLPVIRDIVKSGVPYVGWSAGSNLACPTICTTNDMPVIDSQGLDALNLIPYQINPHYTNALPIGIKGESRNQRLAEFTRLWPNLPVIGLPEENWIRIKNTQHVIDGPHPSWLFLAQNEPKELNPGMLSMHLEINQLN